MVVIGPFLEFNDGFLDNSKDNDNGERNNRRHRAIRRNCRDRLEDGIEDVEDIGHPCELEENCHWQESEQVESGRLSLVRRVLIQLLF